VNDPHGQAAALLNAGVIQLAEATGRSGPADRTRAETARDRLRESLRMRRDGGGRLGRTLLGLGDAAAVLGVAEVARRCWKAALEACERDGDAAGAAAAAARNIP
jgi:hypothetical protein